MTTEYQRGIEDLRALLRSYGCTFWGREGLLEAYHEFLRKNDLEVLDPTETQKATLSAKSTIANHIRANRAFQNKTRKEIAEASGVSEQVIMNMEKGIGNSRVSTVGRVAAALGIRFNFMAGKEL